MIVMWVTIILSLLSAVIACALAVYNRRQLNAIEHSLNRNIQILRRELDVVNSAAVGVGSRLIAAEKKLNGSIEKQQQIEANTTECYSYNKAASLALHGVEAPEIASSCGMSEAEAHLMVLLNKASCDDSPTATIKK